MKVWYLDHSAVAVKTEKHLLLFDLAGKALSGQPGDGLAEGCVNPDEIKDEDVLVSLQLVNEMLSRGYEFLPIELGKSRGSKYVVEDDKVRLPFSALKGLGGAAAEALERVTIHGEEYISVEELQQASGVGSSILDRLRQVGALGDLPESSQVSFF